MVSRKQIVRIGMLVPNFPVEVYNGGEITTLAQDTLSER